MKHSNFVSLSSLFLFIILVSCCKDENDVSCGTQSTTVYTLTDPQKNSIPYTGKDTLTFISDAGDTAICLGLTKQTTYTTVENRDNVLPSCPSNYNKYEIITYPWVNSRSVFDLDVSLNYNLITSKGSDLALRIALLNKLFYFAIRRLNNNKYPDYIGNRVFFNDSIFSGVSFILNDWDVPSDSIFYNTTYGVCGATINSKRWVLLNK